MAHSLTCWKGVPKLGGICCGRSGETRSPVWTREWNAVAEIPWQSRRCSPLAQVDIRTYCGERKTTDSYTTIRISSAHSIRSSRRNLLAPDSILAVKPPSKSMNAVCTCSARSGTCWPT